MAMPPEIERVVLTWGRAFNILGEGVTSQLTIEPVTPGTEKLVWAATGDALLKMHATKNANDSAGESVSLPVVDQPGWLDAAGHPYTDWAYKGTLRWTSASGESQIEVKTFKVLSGQTTIDWDTIFTGHVGAPTVAPLAVVTDVAGLSGSVTKAALEDMGLGASDEGVAALVAQPTSAAHHALTQSLRTVAAGPPRAAGAVCFTWDDGYPNWLSIAQAASARGQRHTFCVQTNRIDAEGGIPAADVLAIHEMGHEIAAHSVSHLNHAASTPAQRAAEYDNSKATLEAIIGAGSVTSYVYPVGGAARNNTTDCEAWGRYDRLRDTSQTGWTPMSERTGPFLIPSIAWVHANVLSSIRRCASQPMIYNVFAHNPDGLIAGVPDITMAQAVEAMDLAQSLGVPCVTMRDAYPGGGLVTSPTLSGSLGAWRTVGDAGAVTVVPIVNPPAGYADTHAVRVTTTTTQFSGVRELIPVTPGRTYVIAYAGRLGVNGAGGTLATGTVYARFGKSIDYAGAVSGWDADSAFTDHTQALNTSLGDKSGAWVRMGGRLTIPEGRRFMEVQIGVTGEAGVTAEFTHVWVGEERFGVFA